MRKLVAAIDLGTSKVVCLVGEKTDAGIKIIALSEAPSKGISRGEVVNIQSVLDSLKPVVQNVENAIGETIREVFVGIAGQNIRCEQGADKTIRVNPDEMITSEEIESITRKMYGYHCNEGEEVIHAVPQSYNIDDFMGITAPVGMIGKQIASSFKLFIGKKTSGQLRSNVISRSNLKLKELILEPMASAKAVLEEDEKEIGVALLDIGGGTSDLIIIQDNIVRHTAVIPFGGNCITEDLKYGCGVSSKIAELLKIEKGSCMSSIAPDKKVRINGVGGREDKEITLTYLAEIIESRVEEILEAAVYEIEKSGYKDKINAGLVITGGTSLLPNLRRFARLVTGFETRLAVPHITFSDNEVPVGKPSLSTAVGLVVMGFEKMEKEGKSFSGTTAKFTKEKAAEKAAVKEETEKPKDEEQKPKKSWRDFFSSIKSDNELFTDNEA